MRRDKLVLGTGFAAAAGLATSAYLLGLGLIGSLGVLIGMAVLSRGGVHMYFERFLAFKALEDFRAERIRFDCTASGMCCRMKVNLGKDD